MGAGGSDSRFDARRNPPAPQSLVDSIAPMDRPPDHAIARNPWLGTTSGMLWYEKNAEDFRRERYEDYYDRDEDDY